MSKLQIHLKNFKKELNILLKPFNFRYFSFLDREIEYLKKKFDTKPEEPEAIDLEHLYYKVYSLWNKNGSEGLKKLTFKEKRYLPWIIYLNKKSLIINNLPLLKAILTYISPPKTYYLKALIFVYLKNFIPSSGTELLRKFILKNLKKYSGQNRRLIDYKTKSNYFFTKDAISKCTKLILSGAHNSLNESLEFLGLTGDLANSNFLKYIALDILKLTEDNLVFIHSLLHLLIFSQESSESRFPDILPEVANRLIPKVNVHARDLRELLSKFFIKYLGDPRLPGNKTRWSRVSPRVKNIFIKWLAEKDIEFFFEVIARTAYDKHWRYRRKFWEVYLPYIESTWVVLGSRARNLIENSNEEYRYGRLIGGSSDQSVILMKIGRFVFVEWSHSGACRIFSIDQFPYEWKIEYYDHDLRKRNFIHYQRHDGSEYYKWQDNLAGWICMKLKIYPDKSYYLEDKKI